MAWSDPKTWTADDLLTASDLNQYVSDNLSALYNLVQGGGRKNLILNGAMQVAQRSTSLAGIASSGYWTADRWLTGITTLGTWTQSVEADAPTGSGFRKSLKMLCTTADASPAAGDYAALFHLIEGQDVQAIKKGTASAEQLTLSFWTKSNKTGTYVVELLDSDNSRHVCGTYTVVSSGTWEQQSITFPADLTGAFDNDNGASLSVNFWLAAGTTYTGGTSPAAWTAVAGGYRAGGQTNLAASTNNYLQLTGVQLEVGSAATGYEYKSFGTELRECQRYYEKSYDYASAPGTASVSGNGLIIAATALNASTAGNVGGSCSVPFKVTKRATPVVVPYDYDGTANAVRVYPADAKRSGVTGLDTVQDSGAFRWITFDNTSATAITAYNPLMFNWTASAELT